ncbi:hypothetical protein NKOR_05865 [Candidatus Nitrosopumilus koreensis AR1]|uniref:Uncharacterized protein n=1 Tax=Candidatus Nitrosopumilus koreensis AR1 TaxID=1229908 RepID=K0B9C9_9ARCH|nr:MULTISPECIES: hypothetical protein [Nitrosopumilus]AFS81056.1 hypothetical protein NKOR_05865 [Candidatus Nitrosopumilus koreensis AR1]
MKAYHFTISDNLMENIKNYHNHYCQTNNTRELRQTITILLKYVLEDIKDIPLKEVISIEVFFRDKEYILEEFLDITTITFQTDDYLRQYA